MLKEIIGITGLLIIGYFALREGFHRETAQEKFIKSIQRPPAKKFPKWYAAMLGVASWVAAFYFMIKILLSLIV